MPAANRLRSHVGMDGCMAFRFRFLLVEVGWDSCGSAFLFGEEAELRRDVALFSGEAVLCRAVLLFRAVLFVREAARRLSGLWPGLGFLEVTMNS